MERLFHGPDHACRVTLTNPAIALHLTSYHSFRRFENSDTACPFSQHWDLNDFERSKAIERLERLERTDPRDERSAAIEPFDRTQGKLLERLERLELVPAWVSDVPNVAG